MSRIQKLALPALIACGLSLGGTAVMAAPAQQQPVYQLAANESLELQKTDRGDGDRNHSGVVDKQDPVGVNTLGDNTNDGIDNDDSENSTFNATFWVLMAIVLLGVAAAVIFATRRRTSVN